MKHASTLFLRFIVLLLGIVVLVWLIVFPQLEGRAKNLDLVSIYRDPLIIYFFIGSVPFFTALFQTFKLLGYVDKNKMFSVPAVRAVRNIKYCALFCISFLVVAILFIRFMAHGDDPAGPTMLGMIAIIITGAIATASGIFQKLLQNGVDLKSENDLTV
jgi:hypothetical protein